MTGTTVCYHHGGKAALRNRGAENGNYKNGRYSKYMPANLATKYHEAANDKDLLDTKSSIALVDAMLADALGRICDEEGYSVELWGKVRDDVQKLEMHIKQADFKKLGEDFIRLRDLANDGLRQSLTRVEVRQLVQERSKLTEREVKRLVAMQNMMTSEQAMALFRHIMQMIADTVSDPQERDLLFSRIAQVQGHAT